MEYEICNRCRLNAMCIYRTQDCKRWNAIYQGMRDDLECMIDEEHAKYNKREDYGGNMDVHGTR